MSLRCMIGFVAFLTITQLGFTQADSSIVHLRLGLMGRLQTGNLKQFSILPNGELSWDGRSASLRIRANYHYLKVDGYTAINDLWGNIVYSFRPKNKWFVSLIGNAGFAASYRFDRSILLGPGLGVNILPLDSPHRLTAYLFTGYLDFKFEASTEIREPGLGSLLLGHFPITPELQLRWELSSYHALDGPSFWGGGNMVQLSWKVMSNLALTATHQTYFNRQTPEGIANTNTQFLFGIQFFNIHK